MIQGAALADHAAEEPADGERPGGDPSRQPLIEMAVAATELALALGRGEKAPQVGVEIATTLTVRESTAPPKS